MVAVVGGDPGSEPVDVLSLTDGTRVALRQIEPDDAERLRRLFYRLSPESVYWRFFTPVHVPREEVLERFASVDHQRREAIVADIDGEVVGVARYDQAEGSSEADTAVLVEDAWQGQGLAAVLLRRLARVAHVRGIRTFTASSWVRTSAAGSSTRRSSPPWTPTSTAPSGTCESRSRVRERDAAEPSRPIVWSAPDHAGPERPQHPP